MSRSGVFSIGVLFALVALVATTRLGAAEASDPIAVPVLPAPADAALRPALWAAPQAIDGLPNLHRVSPWLWRGAQPTAEGMRALERLGVRTVISLRELHDDEDRIEGTALARHRISFKTWHPEDEDVVAFLRLVGDPANRPVFVHCQHGADRTGMMCAITRIAIDGWSRDAAIDEMIHGGFGFHPVWTNLVQYLRTVDVAALAAAAGLSAPPAAGVPAAAAAP